MRLRVRHLCAVLGIAVAAGTVVFMRSLVASNDHQATAVADRLTREVPVADGSRICRLSLDFRPGGRVMQGPPLFVVASDGAADLPDNACRVTKALFTQRRLEPPPPGATLTLVGRRGTYRLTLAEVTDWDRPVRGYPNLFVNPATAAAIAEEWGDWEPPARANLAAGLMSDAGRNFDRSKLLLLWAAALTAVCLLVNSLLLSIEARRREMAVLRMVGLTRGGVVKRLGAEAVALAFAGSLLGCALAHLVLHLYVAADPTLFPLGGVVSTGAQVVCLVLAPVLALVATLFVLKPALAVRPLEAASTHPPRPRRLGMLVSFAFGFGAFVAVEVWGASLMRVFVPSAEWPDAIVSILPGGVSCFDIQKLQSLEGVRQIAVLQPLQVNFDPLEEMPNPRGEDEEKSGAGDRPPKGGRPDRPFKAYRNALLLSSNWLPDFRFVAGDHDTAAAALPMGDYCMISEMDACVITEMMARARGLRLYDTIDLVCGERDGLKMKLTIVGIVDLNWHMVTSRGLLRGLNRMPVNTDGPVFVGYDTLVACDPRPQEFINMTHLWLDFEPDFLARHGAFEAGRIVERRIVDALGGAWLETKEGEVRGNTVRLHARDEIADGTFAHGDDLIGSMARVPFIFIAVISLGFVALLVANADARRREFLVLRTVGATRWTLAGRLVAEALRVAAGGLVFGLLGGALTGWLFTFATRGLMANWGLPPSFAVPWTTLALGAVGAVFFALLFAIPTALILLRPKDR